MQLDPSNILQTVIALLLVGQWNATSTFKREVRRWQDRMDVALFGPDGNNGLNGTVKDHEQRLRAIERREGV
jgi:hypothetical protein